MSKTFNPSNTAAAGVAQPGALELNTPGLSTLSAAPSTAVSWDDFEFLDATPGTVKRNCVDFNVPAILPKRKLYGGLWTSNTVANENWLQIRVDLWLNNTPVGWLPWSTGSSVTNLKRALPSVIGNGGGYVGYDSLILTLDAPTAWAASPAILQPFNFAGMFDRITASIIDVQNLNGVRLYLGCLSYA